MPIISKSSGFARTADTSLQCVESVNFDKIALLVLSSIRVSAKVVLERST
jgi:hypothetical protein